MISIRVIDSGENLIDFGSRMHKIFEQELPAKLNSLGQRAHQAMIAYIKASKKRPGGDNKLEESIEYQFFNEAGKGYGFWIGNIDTMNLMAPFWRWLNWGVAKSGRTIPPGYDENPKIRGEFKPGSGIGRFEKGFYPMTPRKAITAMNYIEVATFQITNEVNQLVATLNK
jgi:hypothetical protein